MYKIYLTLSTEKNTYAFWRRVYRHVIHIIIIFSCVVIIAILAHLGHTYFIYNGFTMFKIIKYAILYGGGGTHKVGVGQQYFFK